MIDWIAKLTSRKFWVAVCGLVTGLLLAFKVDQDTVTKIGGIIMSAASVTAYIFGEGMADAAGASNAPTLVDMSGEGFDEDDGK